MIMIKDENNKDSFLYKGMHQMIKVKVVILSQEKLEVQDASDVSSNIN